MKYWKILLLIYILCFLTHSFAQEISPKEYVYSIKDSIELKAYLFRSDSFSNRDKLPAIVIFHGGGWAFGEPFWTFGRARHFAKLGFVAVAAHFRLANQKDITPLEAMENARDIIIWIRSNHELLKIDPGKIVGYGWSSGAHLVTSAAVFENPSSPVSSSPNALVLVSPAVSLEKDGWFKKLLLNKTEVYKVSPDEHIKKGLPPTLILQGRDDTVTPLSGVQKFTNRMIAAGNVCELIIYDGVGHLFTPSGEPDSGYPNPDPKVQADAYKKADDFLRSLGYFN
jgi:acetyl esterase/lipase